MPSRFRGIRNSSSGTHSLDTFFTVLAVVLVVLIVFFVGVRWAQEKGSAAMSPTMTAAMSPTMPSAATVVHVHNQGGDSRYERAPQPLRGGFWNTAPEFPPRGGLLPPSLPFNIPTQGLPDAFQSVGIVNVEGQVLPLYGRRTAGSRGDRWNYYTRTDTYNPVPLPVRHQKRDCMGDVGCQELMSGDSIRINGMQKEGKIELYGTDGPVYLPGL